MRASFLGLEIQKRSVQMAQKALDVTGNNLSNRDTVGYTRQRLDVYSSYMNMNGIYTTKLARLGLSSQGVFASGVSQTRDDYLDKRYRDNSCYVSEYNQQASIMSEIETALTNFSDTYENVGMAYQFDQFKSALRKYAEDSADREELASVVRNQAYNICKLFTQQSMDLKNLENQTLYDLHSTLEDANRIIEEIVEYNKQIVNEYAITGADLIYNGLSVTGGYGPNEMLDARNNLIDQLSEFGDIHVDDNFDGSVKITMGGLTIIDGKKSNLFVTGKDFDAYNAKYEENGAVVLKLTPVSIPSDLGMYQRGGTHTQNVVKLLNDSQYDEALILVDSLRIVYRSEDSLVLAKKIKTEEDVYIHECDSIVLYQLEWLRIQSLIGQKKYNEVRESLEQYRLQEGDYRDKADSLWMLLR